LSGLEFERFGLPQRDRISAHAGHVASLELLQLPVDIMSHVVLIQVALVEHLRHCLEQEVVVGDLVHALVGARRRIIRATVNIAIHSERVLVVVLHVLGCLVWRGGRREGMRRGGRGLAECTARAQYELRTLLYALEAAYLIADRVEIVAIVIVIIIMAVRHFGLRPRAHQAIRVVIVEFLYRVDQSDLGVAAYVGFVMIRGSVVVVVTVAVISMIAAQLAQTIRHFGRLAAVAIAKLCTKAAEVIAQLRVAHLFVGDNLGHEGYRAVLQRDQYGITVDTGEPLVARDRRYAAERVWIDVFLEHLGLAGHNHGDGLADAARRVQFIEAVDLVLGHIEASLGHEAQTALWRRGLVLAQVVNVRLRVGYFIIADVSVTLFMKKK
jgi:hypothetical protein